MFYRKCWMWRLPHFLILKVNNPPISCRVGSIFHFFNLHFSYPLGSPYSTFESFVFFHSPKIRTDSVYTTLTINSNSDEPAIFTSATVPVHSTSWFCIRADAALRGEAQQPSSLLLWRNLKNMFINPIQANKKKPKLRTRQGVEIFYE